MMLLPSGMKVYVLNQPLDMRKSFNGISAIIQSQFHKPANSGHLFVFSNRCGDKIKLFYWDRNGFVQWYKQLEQGRFRLPRMGQKVYEISVSDLTLLLEGIDLTHAQRLQAY
jgi:transposase